MKTLIIILLAILCLCYNVSGKCAMRGECIEIGGHQKPCPYDGDPQAIYNDLSEDEIDELRQILESRCSFLVFDEEGNKIPEDEVLTCCEPIQIKKLAESLMLADGVLGRCPTCQNNFQRQICEMNCSPEQARFINVTIETAPDGTAYVNEVDYRVYNDFMIDTHASCAGVIIPQTGLPAINLMCGNAAVCDADAWFGFTGDTQINPLAPLQINFRRTNTTADSMHVRAAPCSETLEGNLPCSCVDCLAMCPTGIEPTIPEICTVFSLNCIGFSVGLVFFVISVAVFIFLTMRDRAMKSKKSGVASNGTIPKHAKINKMIRSCETIFEYVGAFSAGNPVLIIMLTTWIAFAMLFGILNLKITTDPLELWSSPESRSRQELNYFNSRFGPFYRAAQVFLRMKGLEPFEVDGTIYGPAFRLEAIQELIKLEDAILEIGKDGGVTLTDVCYAPLRPRGSEPNLEQCVTMSVSVYFGENRYNINNETYLNTIQNCINNYLAMNCMATWGGGAEPEITFGGYEGDNILGADTLLINLPITNHLLNEDLVPVLEWEKRFIDLMHNYDDNWKSDFVEVSFGAERSIEDEIQRISEAEAVPMVISYFLMFAYVVLALGNIRYRKTLFIDTKITVAVFSIIVVLLAIFCSVGVMGYTGITFTLLAINVIPFFVLSVGVDNVFLMVNTLHNIEMNLKEYDDYKETDSFEKKKKYVFTKMMRKVGPSVFVSSMTQITCFGIGTISNFPAVRTFALFASLCLGFLFVFQTTTVVAILAIDYKRTSQQRFDVLCCIRRKLPDDGDALLDSKPYESIFQRLMKPYSTFILKWKVKLVVVIVFMCTLCISVMLIPQLEVGLDQEMALPTDSYVYRYLQSVSTLLRIGPPVYFVLKGGLNVTNPDHQNVICGGQLCNDDSLVTQIFLASQFSNMTYISRSSNSWIDDFVDWASLPGSCCRYNSTDGSFCSSTDTSPECVHCSIPRDEFANGLRPAVEAFEQYIPFFLQDPPTDTCNKGGLASYFANVNYILDSEGRATVYDSNFMAYHTALLTSQDFINAVKYGYEISANITTAIQQHTGLDVEVFPYSVFYVFFEQYLTTWRDTFASLGYSLIGVFMINLLVSGFNFITTFATLVTSIMVVINMMGVMYVWNIPLNAVSCINLIVSIGVSVEFCSHMAYAYATSPRPQNERVEDAIRTVGSTIITGITFTNLPIIVLAFSYTEIIEVFFFRMLFSIVILGFLHGMIFFPVFLSYLNNIMYKS